MKHKKYNWSLLVRDTMDTAFLSQSEMADRLKVSQQALSIWLNSIRNPRPVNMSTLLKLAQDTGLDINNYEACLEIECPNNYLDENGAEKFIRILGLYDRMDRANKKKLSRYAERMALEKV